MMEKRYKIGLFFVLVLISVLVVVLMWKRHTMDGFPKEEHLVTDETEDSAPKTAEELYQVQKMNILTTCDTVCIYENIDKKDGSVSMEEEALPVKYIGLNREELETMLAQDSLAPTLEEKQKGFKSQHLELFSADKIKVLRIYDTAQGATGFYIMEVNGEICVYEHDKETLYFKTGLHAESLPAEVRHELREGKFMDSELQVYHFIESYSS
ncbi:MAG: hypothetical protein K1W08_05200 [Lachnospiraceae bacterium]|jgi:hypothetical protein